MHQITAALVKKLICINLPREIQNKFTGADMYVHVCTRRSGILLDLLSNWHFSLLLVILNYLTLEVQ